MVRLDLRRDMDPPLPPLPPQSQNVQLKEISPENVKLKLRQVLVLFLKRFPISNAPNRPNFPPAAGVSPLLIPKQVPKYPKKNPPAAGVPPP